MWSLISCFADNDDRASLFFISNNRDVVSALSDNVVSALTYIALKSRNIPVKVEIKRNFNTHTWDIKTKNDYEKYDSNTVKFTVLLKPERKKVIEYELTTYHGTRTDEWDTSN